MKKLEAAILKFTDWSHPWTFYTFVCDDKELSTFEIELFNRIWTEANDSKIWSNVDLVLASQTSHTYTMQHFNLTDEAVSLIVRAISYDWK